MLAICCMLTSVQAERYRAAQFPARLALYNVYEVLWALP